MFYLKKKKLFLIRYMNTCRAFRGARVNFCQILDEGTIFIFMYTRGTFCNKN